MSWLAAGPTYAQETGLPFSTEETEQPVELIVRHSVRWNSKTGVIGWDRLEVEAPGTMKLSVAPGSYDPEAKEPQSFTITLGVRGGAVDTDVTLKEDQSWVMPMTVKLEPRNASWNEPAVEIEGLAIDLKLKLDSRLEDENIPLLETFDLREFEVAAVRAGGYELTDLQAIGRWNRPNWSLDLFEVHAFDGWMSISGSGEWGTTGAPVVSLEIWGAGVDVGRLLREFNVPRANEIRAHAKGRMKIEAEGRDWKVLELEVEGEEGTMYLHRRLLHDLLTRWVQLENLTPDDLDAILDSTFGKEQMIPFDVLKFGGTLGDEALHLKIPMKNETMNNLIELNVDRPMVWQAWDHLYNAGLENIKGLEVKD